MSEYTDNGCVINKVVAVPLEYITANPNQPRKVIEKTDLLGLMESIKENGLIQPVVLRKISNSCYEIIAGERRCRACLELGYKMIPALIENVTEQKSAVLALIENMQRKDLSFFEEAIAINSLMEQFHINQVEVGRILGKSQGAIANKLRLLKLSPECVELIVKSSLTERHARALLRLNNRNSQLKAVKYIIKAQLNVEQSETYIEKLVDREKGVDKGSTVIFVSDVRVFFNTLREAISFMKSAGINVKSEQSEDDDYINYTVHIPKSQSYQHKKRLNA